MPIFIFGAFSVILIIYGLIYLFLCLFLIWASLVLHTNVMKNTLLDDQFSFRNSELSILDNIRGQIV